MNQKNQQQKPNSFLSKEVPNDKEFGNPTKPER